MKRGEKKERLSLPGEGGVNESSPARRSTDVTAAGAPASTSPPADSESPCPKCGREIEPARRELGAQTCAGCPTHRNVITGGRW